MNFADLHFWTILLAGLAFVLALRLFVAAGIRQIYDKLALISLGLLLLFVTSWLSFVIFLVVAVGTYWGLYLIIRFEGASLKYLAILIPLQIAPLCFYKYGDFFINQVAGLGWTGIFPALIPVGISFYTFQKVAFVVDTLVLREPLPRFLDYMNFAGFFPQIVAGPIERRRNLQPQMESFSFRWSASGIDEGARWMVVGFFFKCCMADNLAIVFDPSSETNAYLIWLANFVFGLRIYYDFAGYSLIALGLAQCLGVRLTLNFASPYISTSIVEYWRRWHITLSQWFRDYIYFPLGGGRVAWWAANVLLVFTVSGIWHGAGWNFVLWGAIHGSCLVAYRAFKPLEKLPKPLGWLLTLAISFGAWLCFYEVRMPALLAKGSALFTPAAYGPVAFNEAVLQLATSPNIVLLAGMFLTAAVVLWAEWRSVVRYDEPFALLRRPAVAAVLAAATFILAPGQNNGFIYFAF